MSELPLHQVLSLTDRGRAGFAFRWAWGFLLLLLRLVRPAAVALAPRSGLQALDAQEWIATDNDPQFESAAAWWRLPRGWCRVSARLRQPPRSGAPRLYSDEGLGYRERWCTALAATEDAERYEGVAYLPLALKRLRLDPTDHAGTLRVEELRLQPLGVLASLWRALLMLRRKARTALSLLRQRVQGPRGMLPAAPQTGRSHAPYEGWLRKLDPQPTDFAAIRSHLASLPGRPLISIILPVHDPDPAHLRAALDSVLVQLYPNWQLCICDDASTNAAVRELLDGLARSDARVHVVRRAANGGIVAASREALALARGEFVAFLDHDDRLAPWALYYLAAELAQAPGAQVLYSDEDKLDADGRRHAPHLKPGYNPDLLASINYFGHLLAVRRSLVDEVGGLRAGFDGSQDYDLALRCAGKAEPGAIRHVPAILYHWRASPGSTAHTLGAKPYAHGAGLRALRDAFPAAEVGDGPFPTSYRVRGPVTVPPPLVSILIPTRDGVVHLARCIESLRRSTYRHYEVVVVDNASRDPATLAYLAALPSSFAAARVVPYPQPFNFSAINNFAAGHARGEVLLLLNDDIEVLTPDWLEEMLWRLQQPGVGAVGAKLLYPNGSIQHAGVILGIGGIAGHSHKYLPATDAGYFGRLVLPQAVSALTGACLMVRAREFHALGGLNARNLPIAFNDVDFCLRLGEAGLRCVWTPYAQLVHHESLSRGAEDTEDKRARFSAETAWMRARWGARLAFDPCYNPHLTLQREDFSLAAQPRPWQPWLAMQAPAALSPSRA